jgi:orotidine-5'-phosphate decarboxylase
MTEIRRAENLGVPKSEFLAMLERRWLQGHFLCVGLDTDISKIPVGLGQFDFNREIIDATHDLVCAYKPNSAFYEAQGREGLKALSDTIGYIKLTYPGIPVILDAKRADIGDSNKQYARAVFDVLGADAVTLNPYFGREAMEPFLERADKGNIYLVKTSNPGGGEFQDLPIDTDRIPLYQIVAKHIAEVWNTRGNCAIVVGATYPHQLMNIRKIAPNLPFLIPGLGHQGGKAEDLNNAFTPDGMGVIGNNASGIIFAKPFDGERQIDAVRREAVRWHDAILDARPQS